MNKSGGESYRLPRLGLRHQDELPYSSMYTCALPNSSYIDEGQHHIIVIFLIMNTTMITFGICLCYFQTNRAKVYHISIELPFPNQGFAVQNDIWSSSFLL